jgi:hypothetical protein
LDSALRGFEIPVSNNDRTACYPSSLWFFLV